MKKRALVAFVAVFLLIVSTLTTGLAADKPVLQIHFHAENKHTLVDADGNLKPVFALAAERLGIEIESTANPISQDSMGEFQIQATKKFPADIYGGDGIRDSVLSYAAQGAFIRLNELIDEHAPNLKAYLETHPDVAQAITGPDGSIYMINYAQGGAVGRVYFIRQDWLDKLGYEMPTTIEELETVLYAFRNEDPNGNGLKDEIPVFNDKVEEIYRYANLFGARVYGGDSTSERIVRTPDNKFYHAWTADEFRDAIKKLNQWYEDGILDQEAFTRKNQTARPTVWTKDNTGGMTHEWLASTAGYNENAALLKAYPDFKVVAMLPPSYNGEPGFEEHRRALIRNDGWAISAQCEDPVTAIKFIDWFYSEEGNNAANFGIEGETYDLVDGKPVFREEVLKAPLGVNYYLQDNYGAVYKIGYQMNYEYERQWTNEAGQEAYDLYLNNAETVFRYPVTPVMNFTNEERAIYEKYLSNLNNYMDETVQGFITGTIDIDAEWDNYVKKCNEYGAQKLVDLYQKVFDERYAQ